VATTNYGPSTLTVGSHTIGPATATSSTKATITLDRTVAGGLNSLTSASTLTFQIQSSPDGTTWNNEVSNVGAPFVGGTTDPETVNPKTGTTKTTETVGVNGLNAGTTEVRCIATVAGPSSIVVAGSITVS
jgi:hypothetical protein